MAKEIINFIDLSGGVNKKNDKRDLARNEAAELDGLLNTNPGVLSLEGSFTRPESMANLACGFSGDYISEGIANLYYVNPSWGFKVSNRAVVTESSTTFTFTHTANNNHCLSVGTPIVCYFSKAGNAHWPGQQFIVDTVTSKTVFTVEGTAAQTILLTADTVHYAINATYDRHQVEPYQISPKADVGNKYLFRAYNKGKFGFYDITGPVSFFGQGEDYTGISKHKGKRDPWYFDFNNLWNYKQQNYGIEGHASASDTHAVDVLYDNGVMRFMPEAPPLWGFDDCKRPVGLFSIPTTTNFKNNVILQGQYLLRTHCLAPTDYAFDKNLVETRFNKAGGKLGVDTNATDKATFKGTTTAPTRAHQIMVSLGHGDNASPGDWQFASGGEHAQIGLGITFLYDDISIGGTQESRISLLTDDASSTGNNYVAMTGDSAQNDKSLYLYIQIHEGVTHMDNAAHKLYRTATDKNYHVDEVRGSTCNDGYSNFEAWNPRIVGANVYMTHTNEGVVEDPALLATIHFERNKVTGGTISHDDIEASTDWTTANSGTVHQLIKGIKSIPVITYRMKNNHKNDSNTFCWYKTSAIVNRRLYAGNVSYFKETEPENLNSGDKPINKPDRIIRSSVNKFDILPEENFLEIANEDGQNIVKLSALGQKLIVFKHDDMYIVNCQSEYEFIETTKIGYGIINPLHAIVSDDMCFFINKAGIFTYNGKEFANLISTKISIDEWQEKYYSLYNKLVYDSRDKRLLIMLDYTDAGTADYYGMAKDLLVIDVTTGAIFPHTRLSSLNLNSTSQLLNVNHDLYLATSGSANESFSINIASIPDPAHPASAFTSLAFGGEFIATVSNPYDPSGTININSGYCCPNANGIFYPAGVNNDDLKYLFINKAGTWVVLNPSTPWQLSSLITATFTADDSNDVVELDCSNVNSIQNDHILNLQNLINADTGTSGYKCSLAMVAGQTDCQAGPYSIQIEAATVDANYNIAKTINPIWSNSSNPSLSTTTSEDDGASVENPLSFTSFALGPTTSASAITAGNCVGLYTSNIVDAQAASAGVYRVTLDRIGSTSAGVTYKIDFIKANFIDGTNLYGHFRYTTGTGTNLTNYHNTGSFLDENDGTASASVRNDRLLNNIWLLIQHQNLLGHNNIELFQFHQYYIASVGDIAGTSGSKYFDITFVAADMLNPADLTVIPNVESGPDFLDNGNVGGNLLVWRSKRAIEPSIGSYVAKNVLYESKEFSFLSSTTAGEKGGANVKKKVYKLYINYEGGQDLVDVQYKLNSASSWSDARVKNASIQENGLVIENRLPNKTIPSQATITFPDSSSVYTFQFRLKSAAPISNFKIHDMALIYRSKRVK